MNSTAKTSLIVLGVVVVVGILFSMGGWSLGDKSRVVDDQYADLNGSDENTKTSTNGTNGGKSTTGTNTNVNSNTQVSNVPSDATLLTAVGNVVLRVPQTGVDVKLSGGSANFTDSAVKGHVSIGSILAKVPTDDGYDVFVDMSITTDGKPAVIHYVALFRYVNQVTAFTSAVSVGDRVGLYGLTATADSSVKVNPSQSYMSSTLGYVLTLSYLDRKNGEPATANPSVPKTMTLRVKNHIVAK